MKVALDLTLGEYFVLRDLVKSLDLRTEMGLLDTSTEIVRSRVVDKLRAAVQYPHDECVKFHPEYPTPGE